MRTRGKHRIGRTGWRIRVLVVAVAVMAPHGTPSSRLPGSEPVGTVKKKYCPECGKKVPAVHIGDGWYRCERESNHEIPPDHSDR